MENITKENDLFDPTVKNQNFYSDEENYVFKKISEVFYKKKYKKVLLINPLQFPSGKVKC